MKTTTKNVGRIFMLLVISLIISTFNSAFADSSIKVVVKRVIVPNGVATAAMFGDTLLPTVNIVDTNADKVTRIGTALQIEFQNSVGTPVTVENFKATRADFTLRYGDGSTGTYIKRNKTPLGAYHPADQGSPDYFVYNGSVDVTPTGLNKFVAGYNGDNSGTVIPEMTRFVLLDQVFRLGGDPAVNTYLPTLATAGQFYSLTYWWDISYKYGGVSYNYTIPESATEATLLVVSDIDKGYNSEDAAKPHGLRLKISDDLLTWANAPVAVPHPRPTSPLNIKALVPETTDVPDLSRERRFYQYERYTLPLLFP